MILQLTFACGVAGAVSPGYPPVVGAANTLAAAGWRKVTAIAVSAGHRWNGPGGQAAAGVGVVQDGLFPAVRRPTWLSAVWGVWPFTGKISGSMKACHSKTG